VVVFVSSSLLPWEFQSHSIFVYKRAKHRFTLPWIQKNPSADAPYWRMASVLVLTSRDPSGPSTLHAGATDVGILSGAMR